MSLSGSMSANASFADTLTARPWILICAWALVIMTPGLLLGHISGHSSFFNVVWSEGFADRLFSGDIYPRWLPEMNSGAGSPVFYFYGPLPFYVIAPFQLIFDNRMAVVLGSLILLAASGLAFFQMGRDFVRPASALIASGVYMVMPYHLLADVWARSAVGEQAAFVFMPLCLLYAHRLNRSAASVIWLAFAFAGLLFSHLPTALVFSPFLVCFCIWTGSNGSTAQVMFRAGGAAVLGAALAAPYLLPAMTQQGMIDQHFWGVFKPTEHFLFSAANDSFTRFLETAFAANAILAAVLVLAAVRSGDWRAIAPWAIVAAVVAFLVTPGSAFIWNLSPLLDRVQFPWRALSIFELAVAMLLAVTLDTPRAGMATRLIGTMLAVVTGLFVFSRVVTGTLAPLDAEIENSYIAERAGAPEYLPSCRPATRLNGLSTDPTASKSVSAALESTGAGLLPVFFYPFLEVVADGKIVKPTCDPDTGRIRIEPVRSEYQIKPKSLPVEGLALVIWQCALAASLGAGLLLFTTGRRDATRRSATLTGR